ncbi:MAG: glycosyltransferase family 4 protein [Phycisphaera sp. RhM]|nr:glycosyltransferase family 4 protein [Phycisphaera sp. RhM]
MRVLYEGAIFQILRRGGVARYFSELIHHLPTDCQPTVVGPAADEPELSNPQLRYDGVQTEPSVSWLRKLTRDRMQRQITQRFNAIDADVEHWTYYSGLCRRAIRRGNRPLVATILDFVHEAVPSLDPSGKHIALKYDAIAAADHLICISQATHDELCERFPDCRGKASVIPLGTSLSDITPAPLPDVLTDKPYVLFVGRRNSYKNFEVVWNAWKRLHGTLPEDAKLVVVGPPMKRREAAQLEWQDDGSAILMPNVPDALLRTLYEHARGFLFPSRAEGFGLPSLEAMSAGTPVMVSDLPVMREVVGQCGYYFDPDDVEMVAQMMRSALTESLPMQQDIVRAARQRAASFTWQTTAQRTATVYRELAKNAKPSRERLLCTV